MHQHRRRPPGLGEKFGTAAAAAFEFVLFVQYLLLWFRFGLKLLCLGRWSGISLATSVPLGMFSIVSGSTRVLQRSIPVKRGSFMRTPRAITAVAIVLGASPAVPIGRSPRAVVISSEMVVSVSAAIAGTYRPARGPGAVAWALLGVVLAIATVVAGTVPVSRAFPIIVAKARSRRHGRRSIFIIVGQPRPTRVIAVVFVVDTEASRVRVLSAGRMRVAFVPGALEAPR